MIEKNVTADGRAIGIGNVRGKFTDEQVEYIRTQHAAGRTFTAIAREVGCTRQHASGICARKWRTASAVRTMNQLEPGDVAKVAELHVAGHSWPTIARLLNVSIDAVSKALWASKAMQTEKEQAIA